MAAYRARLQLLRSALYTAVRTAKLAGAGSAAATAAQVRYCNLVLEVTALALVVSRECPPKHCLHQSFAETCKSSWLSDSTCSMRETGVF